MSPIIAIEKTFKEFTKKEALIAQYILDDPSRVIRGRVDVIVGNSHSSKPAFIRMCKKMGYTGYADFRYACSTYIFSPHKTNNISSDIPLNITKGYIKKIEELATTIDRDTLKQLAQLILDSNRVRAFGYNASNLSTLQLQMRALKLGIDITSFTDEAHLLETLPIMKKDDLLIYFSVNLLPHLHKERLSYIDMSSTKRVLITMKQNLNCDKTFDHIITLPSILNTSENLYLDNQAIYFIFIEILLQTVSEKIKRIDIHKS